MDTHPWSACPPEGVEGRDASVAIVAEIDDACVAAIELTDPDHLVRTTLVVRGDDDGWLPVAGFEGWFGGLRRARDGSLWAWSDFQIEGTFSTLYRSTDGGRTWLRNEPLDAAVRARGGCCFTGIDAAVFRDADTGAVQVRGMEAPEQGWFGTEDGGARWVWLGERPGRRWRWAARAASRAVPAAGGCAPPPLPVPSPGG